jgi:hypothetical protein
MGESYPSGLRHFQINAGLIEAKAPRRPELHKDSGKNQMEGGMNLPVEGPSGSTIPGWLKLPRMKANFESP